jgi:hypothetical protein
MRGYIVRVPANPAEVSEDGTFCFWCRIGSQLLLCVVAYTFVYLLAYKMNRRCQRFYTSGYVLHFYHTPFLRSLLTFDWFGLRGQSVDLNDTIPIRMAG